MKPRDEDDHPPSALKGSVASALSLRRKATRAERAGQRNRRLSFDEQRLEHVRDFDKDEPTVAVVASPLYFVAGDSELVRLRAHRRISDDEVAQTNIQAFHPLVVPNGFTTNQVDTAALSVKELKAELAARSLPTNGEKTYLIQRLDAYLKQEQQEQQQQDNSISGEIDAGGGEYPRNSSSQLPRGVLQSGRLRTPIHTAGKKASAAATALRKATLATAAVHHEAGSVASRLRSRAVPPAAEKLF
jgi:hypothetical protein